MTNHRLGPHQRTLMQAMRDGAKLYKESGIWRLETDGTSRPVSGERCMGLYTRGLLILDKAEDHPSYLGGRREWYALTAAGRRALGQEHGNAE